MRRDVHCVEGHDNVSGEWHDVGQASVPICDGALRRRVPRAASDTHDDEARATLGVLAELFRAEGEYDGVADRLKEEEREEATDARPARSERYGH